MKRIADRFRSCWVALIVLALGVSPAFGQETRKAPASKPRAAPRSSDDPAGALQAEVERRYLNLQAMMAKLIEAIEKAKETGRVASAMERSEELKIRPRLRGIQDLLGAKKMRDALAEEKGAEKDLSRVLKILQGLDDAEETKEDAAKLKEMKEELERLEKLVDEQQKVLDETESLDAEGRSPDDPQEKETRSQLAKKQRDAKRKADDLRRALDRKEAGAAQDKEGAKDDAQQDGQQSEQGQQGQQGQKGQQGQQASARKSTSQALRRASERMQGASERLDASNLKGAAEDQEEALEALKDARDELEEKTDDQEEENRDEVARRVTAKLQAMLAEQELISAETRDADAKKGAEPKKESPPATAPQGETERAVSGNPDEAPAEPRSLARRERALHTDADDAVRVLEADESSVVAPPLLKRIGEDLDNAASLLDASETGEVAQLVQHDVETALEELIEALKPPEQGGMPKNGQPMTRQMMMQMMRMKQKDLVTPSMEIKMLLSAQRRVRERTERLAALGLVPKDAKEAKDPASSAAEKPGDSAAPGAEASPQADAAHPKAPSDPPDPLHDQARRAAEAEEAVAKLTSALIEKYPLIDGFLLGADNAPDPSTLDFPFMKGTDGSRERKVGEKAKKEKETGKESETKPDREGEAEGAPK